MQNKGAKMLLGVTQGWFSLQGQRGRWSWIGAGLLAYLAYGLATFALMAGTIMFLGLGAFLVIPFMTWTMVCLITQRVRHCGFTGGALATWVILSIILVIPQFVFMFWPGKDNIQTPAQPEPSTPAQAVEKAVESVQKATEIPPQYVVATPTQNTYHWSINWILYPSVVAGLAYVWYQFGLLFA